MRGLLRKLARYATVSAISTGVSMVVLGALVATRTTTPGWANVAATAVGTVPSFELNRRWVWGRSGQRRFGAEVGPFVALSFAGLGLSTLAVSLAGHWATRSGLSAGATALVAEGASAAAFGSLWVAQYVILDRVLFRAARAAGGTTVAA